MGFVLDHPESDRFEQCLAVGFVEVETPGPVGLDVKVLLQFVRLGLAEPQLGLIVPGVVSEEEDTLGLEMLVDLGHDGYMVFRGNGTEHEDEGA